MCVGWAGSVLCPLLLTVTSGETNPKKDGQGAKVTPDLRLRGPECPRGSDLAENPRKVLEEEAELNFL